MATILHFRANNTGARFWCRSCAVLLNPTAKQIDYCAKCASYQRLSLALDRFSGRGGDAA